MDSNGWDRSGNVSLLKQYSDILTPFDLTLPNIN